MKLNRVLIIRKSLGQAQRPGAAADQAAALVLLRRELTLMGISSRVVSRFDIPGVRTFDLIISFGGDGTFMAAAHKAGRVPMLGVNAAPDHSVGFFCAATPANFGLMLARIAAGKMKPKQAPLIETWVDARRLPCLALNDVLFAGTSPAETVRYEITAGGKSEEQKSSGVWISAGPGSSAAISSAGGTRMAMLSRRMQFLVREPCPRPGSRYRMTRGMVFEGGRISIVSHMRAARVYIDGHWHEYEVKRGATLRCRVSRETLEIFI